MTTLKLILGNKNYSSWSLRPWLLAQQFGLNIEEQMVVLFSEQAKQQLPSLSPSGKVPVLHDGALQIWDSLAICEYLNERYLEGKAWPADLDKRAHARAISAEMHSSFAALREEMSMNLQRPIGPRPASVISDQCHADIRRIEQIWLDCFDRYDGPWLFGDFSIADAMYAPIASRFQTYEVALPDKLCGYIEQVCSLPAFKQWKQDAEQETAKLSYCEYND